MRRALILMLLVAMAGMSLNLYSQKINKEEKKMTIKTATFGTGCFWCSEAIFSRLKGVIKVEPGFSGGTTRNPSYEDVCSGTTGHAEVVQITYNSEIITFSTLLEVFWKTHDPTTLNRQGDDAGTQYRSVIYYHNKEQEALAKDYLKALEDAKIWDKPIVTEIVPFDIFFPAENYHDNYYENNPKNSYCTFVITPKVEKFEKIFKDKLKK